MRSASMLLQERWSGVYFTMPLEEQDEMRMMMTVSMPVEAGNAAIANGTLGSTMQRILGEMKAEAAYFATHGGERTGYIFFDMTDSSQLPAVATNLSYRKRYIRFVLRREWQSTPPPPSSPPGFVAWWTPTSHSRSPRSPLPPASIPSSSCAFRLAPPRAL